METVNFFLQLIRIMLVVFIINTTLVIIDHPMTKQLIRENSREFRERQAILNHERKKFARKFSQGFSLGTFAYTSYEKASGMATIFSAYFDSRRSTMDLYTHKWNLMNNDSEIDSGLGVVRVLTILPKDSDKFKFTENIVCVLNYTNSIRDKHFVAKPPISRLYHRQTDKPYQAMVVLCPVDVNDAYHVRDSLLPSVVAVKNTKSETPPKYRPIVYLTEDINQKNDFANNVQEFRQVHKIAICIIPKDWTQLQHTGAIMEFIEYHRLVGVHRFYLYIDQTHLREIDTQRIAKLMRMYPNGTIEKIDWNIYGYDQDQLDVNDTMLAMSDCLYRNSMYDDNTFVLNLQINEYVVLKNKDDLYDLMYDFGLTIPITWTDAYYSFDVETIYTRKEKDQAELPRDVPFCVSSEPNYEHDSYHLFISREADLVDPWIIDDIDQSITAPDPIRIDRERGLIYRHIDCSTSDSCQCDHAKSVPNNSIISRLQKFISHKRSLFRDL